MDANTVALGNNQCFNSVSTPNIEQLKMSETSSQPWIYEVSGYDYDYEQLMNIGPWIGVLKSAMSLTQVSKFYRLEQPFFASLIIC